MLHLRNTLTRRANPEANSDASIIDKAITQKLCDEVLRLQLEDHTLIPLERSILENFRIWRRLMQGEKPATAIIYPTEICNICQDPVKFESLYWASCAKGHQLGEWTFFCSNMRQLMCLRTLCHDFPRDPAARYCATLRHL